MSSNRLDVSIGSGELITCTFANTSLQQPPVAVDDSVTTDEDQPIRIDVLANDTDINGDPLSIAAMEMVTPTHGTAVISGTQIIYTPTANFFGTTTLTYTVSDGVGISNVGTVTIDILPVDDRGDVSCDTVTNSVDALYILQFNVGLRTNQLATCGGQIANTTDLFGGACDVNGDMSCNSVDALFILQCNVDIANEFCPAELP